MMTDRANKVMQTLRTVALRGSALELTDGQLLGRFVERRDETAFEALVRRHGPMVLGVCRRLLRHGQDAEDAFQAVFIVLVRKAASVRPREMVGNWLYGVAYLTARKARAVAARRQARERQVAEMPEPETTDSDPWTDLMPLLDRELSRLPDKYRAPIVLCELEGKTHREAAQRLGCPEGTVSGRLSRGRAMLAKRLARCGLAVTAGALAAALSQHAAAAAVPASLLAATVKTATLVSAGGAAVVSGSVAALTKGVLKAMLLSKLQTCAAVLLTLVLIGLGVGLLTRPTAAANAGQPKPMDAPPAPTPADAANPGQPKPMDAPPAPTPADAANPGQPKPMDAPSAPTPADAANPGQPFDQFSSTTPLDGQTFIFVNAATGRCLSVFNGSRDTGQRIVQGPLAADAGPVEQWRVVKVGYYFKLTNVHTRKVLADPEGSKARNAQMIQWDDLGIEDQQWELAPVGPHYNLRNRASGLLLTAPQARKRVQEPRGFPGQPAYEAVPSFPGAFPKGPVIIAPPQQPWYLQDPGVAFPPVVIQLEATGQPDQVWSVQGVPGDAQP